MKWTLTPTAPGMKLIAQGTSGLAGTRGIDAAMKQHRLDALLFPAARGYGIAATPGYPTVVVPFGMVPNDGRPPFPEGFESQAHTVRRELHRRRLQRTSTHRARLPHSSRRRNAGCRRHLRRNGHVVRARRICSSSDFSLDFSALLRIVSEIPKLPRIRS